MATEKEAKHVEKKELVVSEEPVKVVEPVVAPVSPVVAAQPAKKTSKQTLMTIAIAGGIALFFAGLGLGYLWGHSTATNRNFTPNGMQIPGNSNGERRFYPNSGSNNDTDNNSDNSSSSSSTPQTQTN